MPPYPMPLDHELSDTELALAVAHAIRDAQFNPGMGNPFNAEAHHFVNCLLGAQEAARTAGQVFAANGGASTLSTRLHELCWNWAVSGILVPVGGRSVGEYHPTAYGRAFLSEMSGNDLVPFVPGELARVLKQRCVGIDEVTLTYAGQSQDCFLSGYYEASVLLLGAASETALLRLAEAMNAKRGLLGTPELRAEIAVRQLAEVVGVLRDHRKQIKGARDGRSRC